LLCAVRKIPAEASHFHSTKFPLPPPPQAYVIKWAKKENKGCVFSKPVAASNKVTKAGVRKTILLLAVP